MRRTTVLRDSIWGDIELGENELALIDTPAFQRLRGVRQLGFTDLVFPGAHHTRFEHSLGVAHLAGRAVERLRTLSAAPPLTAGDERTFLAAALLHDIGHYPFSHAVEELEVEQVRDHEELAAETIRTGAVAGILRERWDVDPDLVAWLVAGEAGGDDDGIARRAGDGLRLLRLVLSSGLDVDKLDYLVRDARAANVPYGMVDVQRLVASLDVVADEAAGHRLAIARKGVAALQSLVFAKYMMFATVYWHHACRAAVAMLLRSLQEALRGGELQPRRLEQADDATLIALLRSEAMPPLSRDLGQRLLERRLYKRAAQIGIDDAGFGALQPLWRRPDQRLELEDRWASDLGVGPGSVLIDIPEPKALGTDLPPVVDARGVQRWDEASGLGTADLARFERRARHIRLFARDHDAADRLGRAWGTLLRRA